MGNISRPIGSSVFTRALLRGLSGSYASFYRDRGVHISSALADAQHAAYLSTLEDLGLAVSIVDVDERYPDCVFVEDTAVVWRGHALICSAAAHRDGEQVAVERALQNEHRITRLPAGALLEGGDVLHVGDTTYVGLSTRTNGKGAAALAAMLTPFGVRVVTVPVYNTLHLKSAATYLGDDTLLVSPERLDARHFGAREIVLTSENEPLAANCLRFNDCLIIPAGYPETARRLRRLSDRWGVRVVQLDISEFEKGAGALTCLSILW